MRSGHFAQGLCAPYVYTKHTAILIKYLRVCASLCAVQKYNALSYAPETPLCASALRNQVMLLVLVASAYNEKNNNDNDNGNDN